VAGQRGVELRGLPGVSADARPQDGGSLEALGARGVEQAAALGEQRTLAEREGLLAAARSWHW
jgi:hypothetical protein